MKTALVRFLSWVASVTIPFMLIMTIIRLLFSPLFIYPQVEYRMPYFPPDRYGFSLEDRLHWSRVSVEYIFNNADISFLANQQLADGQPLYNERELSHMEDVKYWAQRLYAAWAFLLVVWVVLAIWAWRGGWQEHFFHILGNGGRLTVALVIFVLAGVAISFNALFTGFHEIFFKGDSWLFLFSDSLIRLFPLPFWRDLFILVGLLVLVGTLLLVWLDRRYTVRHPVPQVQ